MSLNIRYMLRIYPNSIKGLRNLCSSTVLIMNPLITTLVIMLLTVVYIESQFVTDYQDAFPTIFKKNSMPESCDLASQKKRCEFSYYMRQLLKKTDFMDYDDEDTFKNRDLISDDIVKNFGQKRYHFMDNNNNCATVQTHVDLGNGHFPRVISNITCVHTSGETEGGHRICLKGSNCQAVIHNARVLVRRKETDIMEHEDIPRELKACWKFEYKMVHVGCKCARTGQSLSM